jgi:hypothetical protein
MMRSRDIFTQSFWKPTFSTCKMRGQVGWPWPSRLALALVAVLCCCRIPVGVFGANWAYISGTDKLTNTAAQSMSYWSPRIGHQAAVLSVLADGVVSPRIYLLGGEVCSFDTHATRRAALALRDPN